MRRRACLGAAHKRGFRGPRNALFRLPGAVGAEVDRGLAVVSGREM